MKTKVISKHLKTSLLWLCGIVVALPCGLVSCTDTWDDHFEGTVAGVNSGSLWEAIQKDDNLSNFASVIKATGYDRSLGSSQVFTVFAPTNDNFSKQDAQDLIDQYMAEKQNVNDEDNPVIREFVQNHIALYNHSVSDRSHDSITLMNRKYAVLQTTKIDNSKFNSTNKLYENGVLFTIDKPIDFSANIFEYIRKDPDLDSVRSFLYNPMFYKRVFSPGSSVEGGIDEMGRTVYLDSVFYQQDELFLYLGRIAAEDSTLWMVAPTNTAWKSLVDEYSQYFNYDDKVGDLLGGQGTPDSLAYTNTRLAILRGTVFSQTLNNAILSRTKTATTDKDSIYSYNAVLNYNNRTYEWGAPFNYYQYFNPLQSGKGVLDETDSARCSNGQIMKVSDWKIDKLQTFHRWIVVQAESSNSIKDISKHYDSNVKDSVNDVTMRTLNVYNNNFRNKVWGDRFVRFTPTSSTTLPKISFSVHDVLSNIGYDIYLVTAPALANDSNATDEQCKPTTIRASIFYHLQDGSTVAKRSSGSSFYRGPQGEQLVSSVTTDGTQMNYIKLAEDFKFPVSTYNINDKNNAQVDIMIESRVGNTDTKKTKVMNIDCILLVPHGTLELVDALPDEDRVSPSHRGKPGVMLYPHGKDNAQWYYMLR